MSLKFDFNIEFPAKERLMRILSKKIFPKIGVPYEEVIADYLLDNDVIPVVRCKDCKYTHYELDQDDSRGYKCTLGIGNNMRFDFYCERGKR